MLYTATVKSAKPAPLYPFHDERLPSHGEIAPGARVAVTYELGDWRLVGCDHRAGWVRASALRKDPLLVVDLYRHDLGALPNFDAAVATPGMCAIILKATEGTSYPLGWFTSNWERVRRAAGDRYASSFFRGAYHYLRFDIDGTLQADYYLRAVQRAGGWGAGDILPIVDVERGGEKSPNRDDGAAKVTACVRAFVDHVKAMSGRDVILYGRGAMRDLGIRDRFGCRYLWDPQYGPDLDRDAIERVGWQLEDVPLWQYTDGKVGATKTKTGAPLPHGIPGFGAVDLSVVLFNDLAELKTRLVEGA